jgi:DNA-directed RNA polymerase specialized sigma24 family protein
MNSNWSDILCRHHKEWVDIVRSFGESNFAEDIVQEMYVRFYDSNSGSKCITEAGEPNRAYIWISLKNTYLTYVKQKNKYCKVDIDEIRNLSYEEIDQQKHESYDILTTKIKREINSWHEYDQMLFSLYSTSSDSMRDISKGANISLSSIFNSLKNCKTRLKENVGEHYEDYLNEDYHLIK